MLTTRPTRRSHTYIYIYILTNSLSLTYTYTDAHINTQEFIHTHSHLFRQHTYIHPHNQTHENTLVYTGRHTTHAFITHNVYMNTNTIILENENTKIHTSIHIHTL